MEIPSQPRAEWQDNLEFRADVEASQPTLECLRASAASASSRGRFV